MNQDLSKIKIKVFKIKKDACHCYECGGGEAFIQGITKWDEIDIKVYSELRNAIDKANANNKDQFIMVEDIGQNYQEIFDSATEYIKSVEERMRKNELKDKEAREKRAAKALVRKQKQLKKLKKELDQTYRPEQGPI